MMQIGVITKIPEPPDLGNLTTPLDGVWLQVGEANEGNDFKGEFEPLVLISMRKQAFYLGEILVCDEDGREVSGRERKPDKWAVEVAWFPLNKMTDAVNRAIKVRRDEYLTT